MGRRDADEGGGAAGGNAPSRAARARRASPPGDPRGADRYRELLPPAEWPALARATRTPAPPTVLAHPLRIGRDALAELLAREGVRAEAVAWHPHALRLPAGSRPGLLWPFRAGLFQIQEEASLLPVRLLDPRPGERALDLCAAPGGKSAQIAAALGARGTVVANDRSARRLAAVREKQKRLGLLNVTETRADGRRFPRRAGAFDRVLVDAPCSAEGTARPAGAPAEAALAELDAADRERLLGPLRERFALPPEVLAGLRLVRKGAREIHAVAADHRPPAAPAPVSTGFPFVRRGARRPKPTTAGALLLARAARRNVIDVDAEQATSYQRREPFVPREAQLQRCDVGGFVMLRREGYPLGAGLLRRGPDGPVLRAQLPRAWVPHAERSGTGERAEPERGVA